MDVESKCQRAIWLIMQPNLESKIGAFSDGEMSRADFIYFFFFGILEETLLIWAAMLTPHACILQNDA